MVRLLYKEKEVILPENCSVELNNKIFTFKGPLGEQNYDASKYKFTFELDDNKILIKSWHGNKKKNSLLNTLSSHLLNNANGVVKGFKYTLRTVYKHFPIQLVIEENGKVVTVKNFLGAKVPRSFKLIGSAIASQGETKDFIEISGINLEHVSQSAANLIDDCQRRKNNDSRIFLDGIYKINKGVIKSE
ncbi:RL9B [Hepatospora eriocheir]|uniref:RL9B n=1 Tax=Hepatospora eriocheir TaxID=1081669 RepID=A0A1X0QAY5_9MICR|nr:RL9B [Hepatospora eriocheir]